MTLPTNHLRRALAPGLAALALVALANAAAAQVTAQQQSAIRSSCRSDFTSKCSGVTPGGKEALACLQNNIASLSPACKTAVSATIAAPAPVQATPAPAAPAPAAVTAAPQPAPATAPPPPAAAPTIRQAAPKPAQLHKPAAPTRAAVAPPAPVAPAPAPAVAPAAAPPSAAPSGSALQTPFVPGSALIAKACARYLIMHCRGIEPGSGRAVACLTNYANAGNFVGPRCRAALKLTAPLR